ncbi:MAG: DNA repair protein RadC [Candidatus Binatia bacterium]|nr:DNA repair protein RadC [Candidatus Binatia bacterium]
MSGTIKAWPEDDRPREKLLRQGPQALSDAELLAVVLRHGGRGHSAVDLGREVLRRFGHLRALASAAVGEFQQVPGLGPAKAAQLMALVELCKRFGEQRWHTGEPFHDPAMVYAHFRERLAAEKREFFYAVLLDNRHRKIRDVRVSQGSLTTTIVCPRDVFEPVVREAAAAVVFVHNHPSGDPTPSPEDVAITRRLREVGELMGVRVLDHIVIGHGRYVSFARDGYW